MEVREALDVEVSERCGLVAPVDSIPKYWRVVWENFGAVHGAVREAEMPLVDWLLEGLGDEAG